MTQILDKQQELEKLKQINSLTKEESKSDSITEEDDTEEYKKYSKRQLYNMLEKAREARDKNRNLIFKPMYLMYLSGYSISQLASIFNYTKASINSFINEIGEEFKKSEEGMAEERILRKVVLGRARKTSEKLEDINTLYWCNNYLYFLEKEVPIPIDYYEFELQNIEKDIKKGLKEMRERFINLDMEKVMKWIVKGKK